VAAVTILPLLILLSLLFGGAVSAEAEPVSSLDFLTTASTGSDLTLEQMQQQEAVVQNVWWFEKMVVKGGFQHFLLVSDPERIEQLSQDLRTMGALQSKSLLDKALSIVYNVAPESKWENRKILLAQLSGKKRDALLLLKQNFLQQQPLLRQKIADYLL